MSKITRLARELREAQEVVRLRQEELKAAQERVRVLEEMDLPTAMDEAGQKKLTTSDGWDLERDETLRAGISQERMPAAVAWLNSVGFGSIVKRHVGVDFGKGEEQKAAESIDTLRNAGFTPTDKMSVHAMTLQSAVKEMLSEGIEVPMDLLGVHITNKVKMKEAKR